MKHYTLSSNGICIMIAFACAFHSENTHADVPKTLGVQQFRDSNENSETPVVQTTEYHAFNCSQLSNTHVVNKIGSGITKTAFRIQLGSETLIAKRVSAESPDKRTRMGVYKLLKEALTIEKAGAFSIVLECTEKNLTEISAQKDRGNRSTATYCRGCLICIDTRQSPGVPLIREQYICQANYITYFWILQFSFGGCSGAVEPHSFISSRK